MFECDCLNCHCDGERDCRKEDCKLDPHSLLCSCCKNEICENKTEE